MRLNKKLIKFIIFILLIILIIFISNYFDLKSYLKPEKIRDFVSSYGVLSPLIFILIYILAAILFLPGTPLTVASGIIFGAYKGTLYTVIGATIGAGIAFLISRYLGKSYTQSVIKKRLEKIDEYDKKLRENGIVTIIFLRFVPLFPFNGLNLSLGLTKVKFRDYLIATAIGIIPGSFAYSYLGDSIINFSIMDIIIAIFIIILLALSLPLYKHLKRKK